MMVRLRNNRASQPLCTAESATVNTINNIDLTRKTIARTTSDISSDATIRLDNVNKGAVSLVTYSKPLRTSSNNSVRKQKLFSYQSLDDTTVTDSCFSVDDDDDDDYDSSALNDGDCKEEDAGASPAKKSSSFRFGRKPAATQPLFPVASGDLPSSIDNTKQIKKTPKRKPPKPSSSFRNTCASQPLFPLQQDDKSNNAIPTAPPVNHSPVLPHRRQRNLPPIPPQRARSVSPKSCSRKATTTSTADKTNKVAPASRNNVTFGKKIRIVECTIQFDELHLDKAYPICLGNPYKEYMLSLNKKSTMEENRAQPMRQLSADERKQLLLDRGHFDEETLASLERDRKMKWAKDRVLAKRHAET